MTKVVARTVEGSLFEIFQSTFSDPFGTPRFSVRIDGHRCFSFYTFDDALAYMDASISLFRDLSSGSFERG